jgi:hypothetical protein
MAIERTAVPLPTVFDLVAELRRTRRLAEKAGDCDPVTVVDRAIVRLTVPALNEMNRLSGWRLPGSA